MCTMLCPKVFLLDIRYTSGTLIWIPVIGFRGAGCLPICERVGPGLPGTIPDKPENCRHMRSMGSGVGGPDCCPFSSWRCRVRWFLGDVDLLCCAVPIARWFVIICPRGGMLYWIVGHGWCLLFGRNIPWEILPRDTLFSGSFLSLLVVFGRLSKCTISAGSWLHLLRLLWVPSSPPSADFPRQGYLFCATVLEFGGQGWLPPYDPSY